MLTEWAWSVPVGETRVNVTVKFVSPKGTETVAEVLELLPTVEDALLLLGVLGKVIVKLAVIKGVTETEVWVVVVVAVETVSLVWSAPTTLSPERVDTRPTMEVSRAKTALVWAWVAFEVMEGLAGANGDTETEVLPEGVAVVGMVVDVLITRVRAILSLERKDRRSGTENTCVTSPLTWS